MEIVSCYDITVNRKIVFQAIPRTKIDLVPERQRSKLNKYI